MKSQSKIKLRVVNKSDYRFLYNLLLERESIVNISHTKMPTFVEHVKFVRKKPYAKWYIIFENKKKAGSVYLSKQDEIGIFLKKEFQKKRIARKAIKLVMKKNPRSRYIANVSPKNKVSKKFFKNIGFKLIQYTYELTT